MFNDYPYTDFHELNADWILAEVKRLIQAWAQTEAAWNVLREDNTEFKQTTEAAVQSLQAFVSDYFDNLNVQTEINNKINSMVNDGSFSQLITPYIQAQSSPIVVDSINEMTDHNKLYVLASTGVMYYYNGSTFVASDIVYGELNTLTDIKDEIAELATDVYETITEIAPIGAKSLNNAALVNGNWSSGEGKSSTTDTWCRSAYSIVNIAGAKSATFTRPANEYRYILYCFSRRPSYGNNVANSSFIWSHEVTDSYTFVPDKTKFYFFAINTNRANITVDLLPTVTSQIEKTAHMREYAAFTFGKTVTTGFEPHAGYYSMYNAAISDKDLLVQADVNIFVSLWSDKDMTKFVGSSYIDYGNIHKNFYVIPKNTYYNIMLILPTDNIVELYNELEYANPTVNLSVLGDSISTFADVSPSGGMYGTPHQPVGNVLGLNQMYYGLLAEAKGLNILKIDAVSGCTVTNTRTDRYNCNEDIRIEGLADGDTLPDVIIVEAGTNDFLLSATVGTFDQTQPLSDDISTFANAYANMLKKIQVAYPKARVICCTVNQNLHAGYKTLVRGLDTVVNGAGVTLESFNNVIKNVALAFGCEVADMSVNGITLKNCRTMTTDSTSTTAVHLNREGYRKMAEVLYKMF